MYLLSSGSVICQEGAWRSGSGAGGEFVLHHIETTPCRRARVAFQNFTISYQDKNLEGTRVYYSHTRDRNLIHSDIRNVLACLKRSNVIRR